MPRGPHKTVLVPFNLGPASSYDPAIFPLVKVKGPLEEGNWFLSATLREMTNIRDMSQSGCDYRQLLQDMKTQYDECVDVAFGSHFNRAHDGLKANRSKGGT